MTACPERDEDLSALLDGALAPGEARALEEHLARCVGCRAEREALGQLVEQVRHLPRRATPAHFAAAVMARVLEDDARPELPGDVVLLVDDVGPPAPPETPPDLPASHAGGASPHADPATAPTAAVPAPARGAECERLAEELSAHVDGELTGQARLRLEAHLAGCVPCDADMWALDRQRARLRALPRVRPHELFVRQVMSRLEAEELAAADRGRRLAEVRAQRLRHVSWVLRAASLLAAAALSLSLTAPEEAPGQVWLPPPATATRSMGARGAAPPAPPPLDDPPLAGAFDAVLELNAPQGLDQALAAAQARAGQRGSVTGLRRTEVQRELGVRLPAQLVDDLYRDLDALTELDGSPAAARAADAVTVEQDRVVLKTGVVLAGTVEAETPRAVTIVAAGLRQTIDRRRVERIERASQPRTLRVVITERP